MNNEKISNFASIMIAVVTVMGAMVACLASVAGAQASENDFDGLTASIRAEEAIITNNIIAYEHKRAYTTFYRILLLSNLLNKEMQTASDEEYSALLRQYNEMTGIAGEMWHNFFSAAYLNDDNSYNLTRELNETWADDQQNADLNPEPYFAKADAMRSISVNLTANLIAFGMAFFFFTLAEVIQNRWRILFFIFGFLAIFLGLSVVLINSIEMLP